MKQKQKTLEELTKVDLTKSIDENSIRILSNLEKNKISFTEFSNHILNKTIKDIEQEINKINDVLKNTHELYFKKHLSNKLSKENDSLEKPVLAEKIAKLTDKGVGELKAFLNEIQHDLTDKKAAAKIQDIINTIIKSLKSDNMAKQNLPKKEVKEPKLMYKKDDVLFYLSNDKIRVGKVLKDSFNENETVMKSLIYDKENQTFKETDKMVAIDNKKLSKPFKYKNITFDDLSIEDKLALVMGKQTSSIKTENKYKTKVDGIDVEKIFEQDVRFQLKPNKKTGLVIPKVVKPFYKQVYGKEITENDLAILKKGGVLISDAKNEKTGKMFEITMKYDKGLKGVVVTPFSANYLTNKKGVSEKAYVGNNTLDKQNIEDLINGKSVNLKVGKNGDKEVTIGFAEKSTVQERFGFKTTEDIKNTEVKVEKVKKEIKEPIKPKRKKGRGIGR
ncbi:MAG TPA: hypothetical protein EYG85_05630 [Crocinitomix sp.]|nr:hypothetical protein [Crocinitomix sp.]